MAIALETKGLPLYPGWKVVRKIGAGSFGTVYEIEKESSLKTVAHSALKVISIPETKAEIKAYQDDGYDEASITAIFKGRAEEIAAEFALMSKLKGHSNIVSYEDHSVVPHDDDPGCDIFIRMELLTPLPVYIGKRFPDGRIPEKTAVKLGADICQALELCCRYNIIHRDIKPQNIFANDVGDFKLGDFGTAKTIERTSGGTKIGTYNYMAPEVYNNTPYGHGVDIYSLGLVLYWLLNERRIPFVVLPPAVPKTSEMDEAPLRRFRGDPIPEPAHGSQELKRIVLKACAYDPKDRYASAMEMAADLQRLRIDLQNNDSADAAGKREETFFTESKGEKSVFDRTASALSHKDKNSLKSQENANTCDKGDETKPIFSKTLNSTSSEKKTSRTDVESTSVAIADKSSGTDADEKDSKTNKGKKTGIIVSVICALLALAVVLGVVLGQKTPPVQEAAAAPTPTPTSTPTPTPDAYSLASVGDIITFGRYEQDNKTSNGKEEIEWIVLAKDGNRILLISKYAIDCQPYNTEKTGITWKTCTLRKWLNESFLYSAFSASEQNMIMSASVKAEINPDYITEPGDDTKDKLFLLSISEAKKYLGNFQARKCNPTIYAIAQGAETSDEFSKDGKATCWWWLRSPGYDPIVAARIDCDGSVFSPGVTVTFEHVAVRPALWIVLD